MEMLVGRVGDVFEVTDVGNGLRLPVGEHHDLVRHERRLPEIRTVSLHDQWAAADVLAARGEPEQDPAFLAERTVDSHSELCRQGGMKVRQTLAVGTGRRPARRLAGRGSEQHENSGERRDGQRDAAGKPEGIHGTATPACSSTALNVRAACSGSGASPMARTTASRAAPASTASSAVVASMPPIANQGTEAWAAA